MNEVADALARFGGKGLNLQRLADAGLPVPRFVIVPTDEYRAFLDAAHLHAPIADALAASVPTPAGGPRNGAGAAASGPATPDLAQASATIRAAFAAAKVRRKQRRRLLELVGPLLDRPLAVRSSATAEDLPDLSFAGQHDSFLDVRGADAVLAAIVACWASAWTERALAYRARNGMPDDEIAVAVVVQEFVPADAAGVLFTANPLTGRRDESVIDAVWGLGDQLVSGHATPETYVIDTESGAIKDRHLVGERPALTRGHAHALNALGVRVASLFGVPQDIEWVRTGDDFQLVQARPITSLYPLPDDDPDALWFSFGGFQGMLGPITPLGQDLIRHLLAGAARAVGHVVDPAANAFVRPAGERLWFRLDGILRNRAGRRLATTMFPLLGPAAARIVAGLLDEPTFAVNRAAPSAATGFGLAGLVARMATRAPALRRHPETVRARLDERIDAFLASFGRSLAAAARVGDPRLRLENTVLAIEKFGRTTFGMVLPAFGPIMGPGILMTHRLQETARRTGLPDADALALQALRALPGNVTTAMDIALWDLSRTVRSDPHAWGVVADTDPAELARRLRLGHLPPVAQTAIEEFLAAYGMRGIAEIDLGTPRWRDDPTPLLATLQSYVDIDSDAASPRVAHAEGQRAAAAAIDRLATYATASDARSIRADAAHIRATMGARETPKFGIIRGFGMIRERLADEGAALADARVLARPDDIYFLTLDELLHAYDTPGLAARVAERRALRTREERRAQVPRVMLGDGRTFYEGMDAASGGLSGAGVSPGVAEGVVRVVLDPARERVLPGEILVCPGTDPAWTPLFLHAAGLVTEVGGLMTHGSVVAREYGIPAVVGVHEATVRLRTGQRVRIDGASGVIELLDPPS